MSDPIELPTETRWRCQKCGKDVEERLHVPFIISGVLGMFAAGAFSFAPQEITETEPWAVLCGPPERGHTISHTSGGAPGVMGGWRRHTVVCGPLRLTEIDVQELFVEWWLQGAGGKQ